MKKVELTNGKFAIVDNEDFKDISLFNWFITGPGYAGRMTSRKSQKRTVVLMHKEVVSDPRAVAVDHINGDKLDNRRNNLRICTVSQNNMNSKKRNSNTSGYKGVSFFKQTKRWHGYINKDGKRKHLGYFSTAIEAAKAYNNAAIKMFGEFAKLNPIK